MNIEPSLPCSKSARYSEGMQVPPEHQLDLCDPYKALCADYRVVEMTHRNQGRVACMDTLPPGSWKQLAKFIDYDQAVGAARDHCLLTGRSVWIYDRNDANCVVFRVSPDEYTASGLVRLT